MSQAWSVTTVANSLTPISVAGKSKIQTKDYLESGRYPVIDQGQDLVAGWTNDETAVIKTPLPIIVFGDHTRSFKFMNCPFARGADGTQLLRPKSEIDPLFFFYACRAIDLPARGYNRHFTILKEKEFSYPDSKVEQLAIAKVLHKIEDALNCQTDQLKTLQELKQSTMRELFTRGLNGEEQKETEIGPIPKSWKVDRLDNLAKTISTRMSYTELAEENNTSVNSLKVLGVKVSDMNRDGNETLILTAALEKMIEKETAEYRCAPPNTIIFPKRGAAIATNKKRLTTTWTVFDPNVIGVIPTSIDSEFLFHWFQNFDLRIITEPGPTPQLNKKHLDPLLIPVPSTLKEQQDIAALFNAIDKKISLHRDKSAILEELFKSLLHKLMTGEIRVSELDLTALESTSLNEATE